MNLKVCKRCCKAKQDTFFRPRTKGGYSYFETYCRKCESEIQHERYVSKLKNDPVEKEKVRVRGIAYRERKKEEIKERMRLKRQTDRYKKYVKRYYRRNREKILAQHRPVSRKYNEKQIRNITEQYVLQLLSHPREGIGGRDDVRKYPELIQLYQSHLKLKRLCKKSQTLSS